MRTATLLGAVTLAAACARSPEERLAAEWDMLGTYCLDCHNRDDQTGGLSLDGLTPDHVAEHPELWEKVVAKLRGRLMPPPGGDSPHANGRSDAFVSAVEAVLDAAAAQRGHYPGRVALHRLNRVEYATAVEELLGVNVDVERLLPPDVTSDGFDNVAQVLRVSPTYLDQYIAAARAISIEAVGDPFSEPVRTAYRNDLRNRTVHVAGLPLGTRGGFVVEHYFPADGEYVFNLDVSSEPGAELRAYPQGWLEYRHTVVLMIDGVPVFQGELGGEEDLRAVDQLQIAAVNAIKERFKNIRLPVKAGYRKVAATFIARSYAESDFELESFAPGELLPDVPQLLGMTVLGPYAPSGIGETTRTRERIFVCYPRSAAEELPCAEKILSTLARRAFRRPVAEDDLVTLLGFYRAGHAKGGFEAGIQRGLFAILASTNFLYRGERDGPPEGLEAGEAYEISDVELASRLAFFLWGRGPDDELLGLAEAQRLSEPEIYAQQVRRMLADPRSKSLVTNFAFQWLDVRNLDIASPDERLYPNFDEDLRRAFEREMELFLDSILRDENRSVVELLTASHTFVNERLALHYGIPGIVGDRFRRVELKDPNRWGLLGKGSVLTVTSYPDRTSPVLRGAWIMEHLLGSPPSPPPPGVETNLAQTDLVPRSVRERLEQHRKLSSCNNCHGIIDPPGNALENFNAIGEWRTEERDSGVAIDSSGELAGVPVSSPAELREALAARPEQFVQTLVKNLMTYALGRTVEYYDMPAVRAIVRQAAEDDYSFASIVMGVANSAAFRMRVPDSGDAEIVADTRE
ncbi:MAG TPA: DUF1592 domain-containing protein [Gammaproteobacteria bacterium]